MLRIGLSYSITAIAALLSVFALPTVAAADTITLAWDPSPSNSVVGYVVYASGPSGYSRTFDVGETVVFPFTEAVAGQQYCFAVAAYASGPLIGARSGQVCGYSDAPPQLAALGNRSSQIGQSASLQLNGDDPDGQPVSYTVTGLPTGLSVQGSTGFISGTPTTVGTYTVRVTVFDGVLSAVSTFTWTIVAPDGTAPSISITSPTSSSSYSTSSGSLSIGGSASDNVSVSQVTWVNNRGGTGTASGRTSWTASVGLVSGTNVITVTALDTAGNQASDVVTVTYSQPTGPLAVTSLTANRSTPQPAGTGITFTATVSGGVAPQQYKWWVYDGATWFVTRNWSTDSTWTWTPTTANSAYRIGVWARNGNSSTDAYANAQSNVSIAFPISGASSSSGSSGSGSGTSGSGSGTSGSGSGTSGSGSGTSGSSTSTAPLTLTSLTADRPAPQPAGSAITFTAIATGAGSPYQYKWFIYNGSSWVVTQTWTSSNQWTWRPNSADSGARVAVWVRKASSTADAYDNANSNVSIPYPISAPATSAPAPPPPPTTTTTSTPLRLTRISSSRSAPSPVGAGVQFTASVSGGVGPQQYKWFLYDGSSWLLMSNWTTSNQFNWVPQAPNSQYRIGVWVRSANNTADMYENANSNGSISFPVN